jgi:hypothetical protein
MSLSRSDHFDALAYPLRFDSDRGRYAKSETYEDYVRGLVLQVLLTAQGQRINRPDFGTPLSQLLFAPLNDELTSLVEAQVSRALAKWLDKVIGVDSVTTRQVALTLLEVHVTYTILATGVQVKTLAAVGS